MGKIIKDFVSPDPIFNKLYEAAPKVAWYVSSSAEPLVRSATDFAERFPPDIYGHWSYPEGTIGSLKSMWVYIDEALEGKRIELRADGKVLSAITLEAPEVEPSIGEAVSLSQPHR